MFYNLNKNCRYLRKKSKLTVSELAEKLEISTQALTNFEGGNRNCSLEVLDKLHNIFEITIDDLVYKDLSKDDF